MLHKENTCLPVHWPYFHSMLLVKKDPLPRLCFHTSDGDEHKGSHKTRRVEQDIHKVYSHDKILVHFLKLTTTNLSSSMKLPLSKLREHILS